jgi:thiaminase
MNTLRETAETFELNQWLSDTPCDMTYQEILDQLRSDEYLEHDDIIAWEAVEDYSGRDIAEMIDDTRSAFERAAADLLSCAHE